MKGCVVINIFAKIAALTLSVAMVFGFTAGGEAATTVASPQEGRLLIPVGRTAGIKLFADGVLVVGLSEVISEGVAKSPAKEAGIQTGDIINAVDGRRISSTAELKSSTQRTTHGPIQLDLTRGGASITLAITPVVSDDDGSLRLGAWVRDSMAGIGTLTYYDPESGTFGALGHGINDTDTGTLMPLAGGTLVRSSIASVRRGQAGNPGELIGSFDSADEFGSLYSNTERGLFGSAKQSDLGLDDAMALPMARKEDIKTGKAVILSNVEGDTVQEYEIEILKVNSDKTPRDMTIQVTDKRLIDKTGGIVQGMSGSPIIQNGKIIGAVTHVLINEPTRGYAIFINNMIEFAKIEKKTAA